MEDGDTCEQAVEKIQNALKGRGNQTAAVHKLFCSMVQANQTFDAWHKKVCEDQGGVQVGCRMREYTGSG